MNKRQKNGKQSVFALTSGAGVRLSILLIFLGLLGVWFYFTASSADVSQQAKFLEAVYKDGNYIEAGIWNLFALGFAIRAFKSSGKIRHQAFRAMVTFGLFGLSDIVEVQTGAWWHPWWLLLWKVLCVLSMFCLLFAYIQESRE